MNLAGDVSYISKSYSLPRSSQLRLFTSVRGLDFTRSISLTFMASEGPCFRGEKERLGIYSLEHGHFEATRVSDQETCLNVLASSQFLKGKTKEAREQYQIVMEDVVATRRSVVNIIPGEARTSKIDVSFLEILA